MTVVSPVPCLNLVIGHFSWLTSLFWIFPPLPKGVSPPSNTPLPTSCDSPRLGCPGRRIKHTCMINLTPVHTDIMKAERLRCLWSLSHLLLVYLIWKRREHIHFLSLTSGKLQFKVTNHNRVGRSLTQDAATVPPPAKQHREKMI